MTAKLSISQIIDQQWDIFVTEVAKNKNCSKAEAEKYIKGAITACRNKN